MCEISCIICPEGADKLSHRDIEDILAERGITISREAI
jgi:transposase-like protein